MKILVLNCGSSSVKYMVYDWEPQGDRLQGYRRAGSPWRIVLCS